MTYPSTRTARGDRDAEAAEDDTKGHSDQGNRVKRGRAGHDELACNRREDGRREEADGSDREDTETGHEGDGLQARSWLPGRIHSRAYS
jgi:hypothetical protein